MKPDDCPICGSTEIKVHQNSDIKFMDGLCYECPRCGLYNMMRRLEVNIRSSGVDPRLSAWIRRQEPQVQSEIPTLKTTNFDDIIANLPSYSVSEKQLILLRHLSTLAKHPGEQVTISPDVDYPVAWATSGNELIFLLESLVERGLIKEWSPYCVYTTTAQGWDLLDKEKAAPIFHRQVFVAMSFDPSLEPAYSQGIKVGIERAGYVPLRVDKTEHVDRIDAKIISEVKDSAFLVADVTHQKAGVYFEAGFALGLNRTVIWSVRKDELNIVHFDTRQYNHIVWEQPEDLAEALYYRICAVMGRGGTSAVQP